MKTRSQEDMALAEDLVSQLEDEDRETQRIYGGLCHKFPVLVRSAGLCQALAFSKDKSTSSEDGSSSARNRAHARLLRHAARVLDVQGDDPLPAVLNADLGMYMVQTQRILDAWIFFKRFSVSILKVESAVDEDAAGEEGAEAGGQEDA